MGMDFYIVCEETRERFALGGGPWGGYPGRGGKEELNYDEIGLDLNSPLREFQAAFASHVMECWDSGYIERPYNKMKIFQLGCEIWQWCKNHDWRVKLTSDYSHEYEVYAHYPITGTRFVGGE